MSLVAYGESSESENEDSVDKTHKADKGGQDVRKLLSVLPNPSKGKQQPVRLAMPSLKHHKRGSSDDSDSDDDTPAVKRKGRQGHLSSILPPPKNASKIVSKTTSGSTPSSMIPYSLTKRPTPRPSARGKRKALASRKVGSSRTGEDSDSDEEPASFFSNLESTVPAVTPDAPPPAVVEDHSNYGNSISATYETVNTAPSAPKPFSVTDERGVTSSLSDSMLSEWTSEDVTDTRYNEPVDQEVGPVLGVGPGLSMDEQAYRRLIGGKRKRGRDPSLNELIEIKEDDVKVEIENYRKHNSDETVDRLYKAPDGAAPTGQQKRKHQLTYLAHEAKANELKLLKQWGQSAASRRDTQMKYGF